MKLRRRAVRRRAVRIALLTGNVLILAIILAFVLQNPRTTATSRSAVVTPSTQAVVNPLDQLSSADICARGVDSGAPNLTD